MYRVWCCTPVIPATHEAEIRRMRLEISPGKNLVKPHLNKQAMCDGSHLYSQMWSTDEAEVGESPSETRAQAKAQDPI
jgi:hypothetical protein